jgi:DNA-binding transcriptional LysR family regulator
MELMQLRYFREVVQENSVSKAAEKLHITQSALSKSIAKLEDELGVRLFERQGNHIHVNRLGNVLLHYTDQAILNLESGAAQIRSMAGLENGFIRIGCSADVFIKHLIREFLFSHPDVYMTCLLQSHEQMQDSLDTGRVDFTLSTDPIVAPNIEWIPLYRDHLTVILPTDHPLAQKKGAYLREFSEDRFIITNLGYGMESSTRNICRMAGFEPTVIYEGYDTEMAPQLIAAGMAVEITPHSVTQGVGRFLQTPPKPGVVNVDLLDSFTEKTIGININRSHYQSEASEAFMKRIIQYFSELS